MKILHAIMTGMALAYAGIYANAQSAVDSVKVTYKDKTVVVRSQGDESKTSIHFNDSLTGKKILVKVQFEDDLSLKTMSDTGITGKKVIRMMRPKNFGEDREKFIETSFLPTFDIGFASTMNDANSGISYTPKMNKSANLGIGLIRQNMNLVKGQLLLSYALNLNNYYLKYSDKQQMQYIDKGGLLNSYRDSVNNYDKNRTDIRYLSVPVLLEYHSKSNKFNIAAGVEFSFNGHTRSLLKGDTEGKEFTKKSETDIKINPVQMAAVVRIGIEDIAVFGKYAFTDMYSSSAFSSGNNPSQRLYSFGICILGI